MADNDKPKQSPPGKGKTRLNIKVNDDVAKGAYANLPVVHNNDTDFIFDFIFVEPQRAQGQVVSRVVTNARTAKRLQAGLSELIRLYEERFGPIPMPERSTPGNNYH
jgi:hypothetical protein